MIRPLLKLLPLVALSLITSSADAAWDLNDLAMLLPLPNVGEENLMLSPLTKGADGAPLIPVSVYQEFPLIVVGIDKQFLYQQSLRAVAIRFDPCFREGTTPQPCQRQIRFVWQPLRRQGNMWSTEDAALHTFHLLNEAEWAQLLTNLRNLKNHSVMRAMVGLPLQVHPQLRTEGYRGPFWAELRKTLLSLCRTQNLIRATAMTTNPARTSWVFTGFDIRGGRTERMTIPGVSPQKAQAVLADPQSLDEFRLQINPTLANEDPFLNVLVSSANLLGSKAESTAVEGVRRALALENPKLTNAGTVDCASCHVARGIPLWARRRFPQWNWATLFAREIYRGPGNLSITTPAAARTNVLRSFGYIDREPVISARVIQETSANLAE